MAVMFNTRNIYLGNLTGGIINMPMNVTVNDPYMAYNCKNQEDIDELFNLFGKYLNSEEIAQYKYVFAITANKYQIMSRDVLIKNGFREVKEFYSSHANSKKNNETLSLFVKTNLNYRKDFDFSHTGIISSGLNCTISTSRELFLRFVIIAQRPEETNEGLKQLKYSRVKNTPIWFRVDPDFVVKK